METNVPFIASIFSLSPIRPKIESGSGANRPRPRSIILKGKGNSIRVICTPRLDGSMTREFKRYCMRPRLSSSALHACIQCRAACAVTERGKVNARRSVFTVMQPLHDYVYFVNRPYKYEIRSHGRVKHQHLEKKRRTWDGARRFRD